MRRYWFIGGLALGGAVAYACTVETPISQSVAVDSLYVEPGSAVLVLEDTLRLTAIAVDETGRRFVDTRATWVSHDATIALSASGTVVALSVGPATVTASSGGLTATTALMVLPKPAFATSRDSIGFTAFANGPNPADQTVTISNGGGGSFTPSLDSIRYAPGASGWLAAALTGTGPETLTLGILTTALPVGTHRATIFLSSPGATNSPKVLIVTLAIGLDAPSMIVADSGNGQAATVNNAVAIVPVARVVDQYANPLPGVAVTFAVTGGGGSVNPTTAVLTDAAGRARAASWTLGTTAGVNTLRASTPGVTPATFTATGVAQSDVSPTQSSVVASSSTITACASSCVAGTTASTITVTVRDGFGNPIANAAVTVSATGGNSVLSSSSGMSNASGVFTTTFSSSKAEAKSISATGNGGSGAVPISQAAAVTVNAAAPASVSVSNTGYSVRVGTDVGSYPTYTVRDAFSNVVPSYPVSYSSSFSGGFVTSSSTTNASGQVSLTSWTMAGTNSDDAFGRFANNVTVTANGFSGTATDYGIYTYSGDAAPILNGCTGCHYAPWSYANIVNVTQSDGTGYTACNTGNSVSLLVSAGNANASLIYLKTAGTSVGGSPPCGTAMPAAAGLTAAQRTILRAWINNGAPNN